MNLVASLFDFSWFSETLRRPTSGVDMLVILGLVLIGFLIGIVVGWVWRPRWAGFSDCVFDGSVVKSPMVDSDQKQEQTLHPSCSSSVAKKDDDHLPKDEDLKHLWHLVEKRNGGPPWKHMMDGSTATMTYQAWQRDHETGPPQYCSMTVYEEATPELLRDFFWDDDLRLKWDDMLLHATTLEEFPAIGASVVHWIRKFPLFCSDREYIIGRRIWELEGSFYCVTKVPQIGLFTSRAEPSKALLELGSNLNRAALLGSNLMKRAKIVARTRLVYNRAARFCSVSLSFSFKLKKWYKDFKF